MKKLVLTGFLHALGVAAYVAIVAFMMQNGEKVFGTMKTLLGPMAFLMIFVLSAAVTGSLVLGRSVLMYLENKKKEAVALFFIITGWIFVFIIAAFLIQTLIS